MDFWQTRLVSSLRKVATKRRALDSLGSLSADCTCSLVFSASNYWLGSPKWPEQVQDRDFTMATSAPELLGAALVVHYMDLLQGVNESKAKVTCCDYLFKVSR